MNKGIDEITRDVKLVYTDGLSEWFEAIHMTENGVVIDRIINGKVIACGFIPKRNIKEMKIGRGGMKPEKGREVGRISVSSSYPLYYCKSATSPLKTIRSKKEYVNGRRKKI
jgi:hypothetical protein